MLFNVTGDKIFGENHGRALDLRNSSDVSFNLTLLAFTQFRLDIGSPENLSVTYPLVNLSYVEDVNYLTLRCNDVYVKIVDLDCE